MPFEAENLRTLSLNYTVERSGLDPGNDEQDLAYDAALRVGEEIAIAIASDVEAAVDAILNPLE